MIFIFYTYIILKQVKKFKKYKRDISHFPVVAMWPGAGKQKGNSGGPPVPGWVEVLEPCYFFFRNTPVKKSFSSSFHPSRTGCAWMCHLSVPWHTRDNPPKIIQNWCLIVFAKYGKKIGKSGRPKMLNLLLCHMWKRWFWGATFHFFGINVPGCAILVFRGSLPKNIWPLKNA